MTNGFLDTGVDYDEVSRLALVRAEDLNSDMAAAVAGFDKLPSEARLKEGRVTYCGLTTGAANAQAAVPPYTLTVSDGTKIRVKWGYTNTQALTLTVVPFGTLAVANYAGAALTGGEALASSFGELAYHSGSNHWRITSPLTAVGSVTTFDISALTAFTTPDDLDYLAMHDTSGAVLQKILPGLALISGWTANAAPLDADTLLTLKAANGLLRKVALSNLLVSGWTVGTDVDATADYTLIYDASAGVLKKVLTGLIADEYSIILKGQLFAGA